MATRLSWFARHRWAMPAVCIVLAIGYVAKRGVQTNWVFQDTGTDLKWQLVFFAIGFLIWVPLAWLLTHRKGAGPRIVYLTQLYLATSTVMAVAPIINALVDVVFGRALFEPIMVHAIDTVVKLFQVVAFFILVALRQVSQSPRPQRAGGML